jgi:hypothetical protein
MASNHTNDNNDKEPFHVFNYTQNASNKCFESMDTPTMSNQSDAESNKLCCDEMKCFFCWPLILVFDILSCPFRGCIHLKNNYCCDKK